LLSGRTRGRALHYLLRGDSSKENRNKSTRFQAVETALQMSLLSRRIRPQNSAEKLIHVQRERGRHRGERGANHPEGDPPNAVRLQGELSAKFKKKIVFTSCETVCWRSTVVTEGMTGVWKKSINGQREDSRYSPLVR